MRNLVKNDYVIFVFMLIVALAAFSPSFSNLNFFWDDERFIFLNPEVTLAPHWYSFWITKSDFYKTWPLGYSIFWILIKNIPSAGILFFKSLNVFVHTLNGFLLYRLLKLFRFTTPLLLSFLFILHPLNVETVSWIFQLLTLLSFTLFLSSFFLVLKYVYSTRKVALVFALIFFLFSLWTKSIALFAPFLFMITLWIFNVEFKKQWLILPFLVISFYIGAITVIGNKTYSKDNLSIYNQLSFVKKIEATMQESFSPSYDKKINSAERSYFNFLLEKSRNSKEHYIFKRGEIFGQAPWHYLKSIFVPVNLQFIYPKINYGYFLNGFAIFIFFILPIFLCALTRKKKFLILSGFSLVFLLPYLGLTNITFFYFSFVSDRYTYGLILVSVFAIGFLIDHFERKWIENIVVAYVVLLSLQTLQYGYKFNSPIELYTEILTYKKDVTIYSALFDQYLLKLDILGAEKVLNEKMKLFPNDEENDVQQSQLDNLKIFYDQN